VSIVASDAARRHCLFRLAPAVCLLLAACGSAERDREADRSADAAANAAAPFAAPTAAPGAAGPGEPGPDAPSYEVSIAIAAANRNRELDQCETRPTSERRTCRAEIEAKWEVTKAALEPTRGQKE